jgi:hypothetical protein
MRGDRGRRVPAMAPDGGKQREIQGRIGLVFASTSAPGPVLCPAMAHVIERNGRVNVPSHWKGELQNTDINENGHFMTEWLK